MIRYDNIMAFLDDMNFKKEDFKNNKKMNLFNEYTNSLEENISQIIITSTFSLLNKKIFTEKDLEIFVDKETYTQLKINKNIFFEIEYIFKKKMIIFFIDEYNIIKIIFHSSLLTINNDGNILKNITYYFDYNDVYKNFCEYLKTKTSKEIIRILISYKIFECPKYMYFDKKINNITFTVYHEEGIKQYLNHHDSINNIINPNNINFNYIKYPSYRGLDNVGATCYMNATLQCLANIKPLTEYFLRKDKYSVLFQNKDLCFFTLNYIQVLIGLFCNESRNGSYSPDNFKKILGEHNPLFRGVKANDSKDLIIFLLEIINTELVKIYNKIHNIKESENELYQKIDATNEEMVLKYFANNFKKSHCSIIGDQLCGFQKTVFICSNCNKSNINFNIYNILIFGLQATSDYFNLSQNNCIIPNINFDNCFQFLSKEEILQNTYCRECGKTGICKYREILYTLPNYLIIILNRGKGNIFNCNVEIPETFLPSNYVEKNNNNKYELIGIVSHLGESGMGGHFIAICKHSIDGKWRIYNDSIVTECQNDYLKKGIPYILFYKKMISNGMNYKQNIANINQGIDNMSHPNLKNQFNNNIVNNNMLQMNMNNNFSQNINNNFRKNRNNNLSLSVNDNFSENINNNISQNINNNFPQNKKNNLSLSMNNNFSQNMNNNFYQNMNNNFPQNMNNNFPQNMNNNFQQNMNNNFIQNMNNNINFC